MKLRIALLADLAEAVGPDARRGEAALAFDLAEGLAEIARDTEELAVDLFARRGSSRGLPLVSLDPGSVAPSPGAPRDLSAVTAALYTQLVLAGMVRDYDLVHCLAPMVTPLQLLAAQGVPVVQTVAVPAAHLAAWLPPRLIAPHLLRQASALPLAGVERIPPGVDTGRFRPLASPTGDFLLWLGAGRRREAVAIAAEVGLPLRTWRSGDPLPLLQNARALLDLGRAEAPAGPVWPLRALACGTPVAGWERADLSALLDRPELGALAPPGDVPGLAAALRGLPDRGEAATLRRELVLGRYSRRALVARYRELYRSLTTRPA